MPNTSPEEVFRHAQVAMERGDWHEFFETLDTRDLKRILNNSFTLSMSRHGGTNEEYLEICRRFGLPVEALTQAWASGDWPEVKRLIASMLNDTEDLPTLAAELEGHNRALIGGGSVSSRLFLGETLDDVVVDGPKARAVRRITETFTEPVGFVRTRDGWFIRLFVRRR